MGVEQGPGEEDMGIDESQRVEDVDEAEAMARAGDSKRSDAARHRMVAQGKAKETVGDKAKRGAEQAGVLATSYAVDHDHEKEAVPFFPEKWHKKRASQEDEAAEEEEKKAGEKWQEQNKK